MGFTRFDSGARRLIAVAALFVVAAAIGGDLDSLASANPPLEPLARGESGDYWADVVIGQPDFSHLAQSRVVPFKLFNPGGVAVDRSVEPGRAYVWDSGNNRILGMNLAKCYAHDSPCIPDVVLGQPSMYDHSGCNGDSGFQNFPYLAPASAETLCSVPESSQSPSEHPSFVNMFVDDLGNLYVPDSHNHRVLLFEDPFGTDSVADAVWGQPDFTGFTCNRNDARNPTSNSLCFHSSHTFERGRYGGWSAPGVALDSDGNMWVADPGNNRVLRFPYDAELGRAADSADLVLGQPDFASSGRGDGMSQMYAPAAARFDGEGNLLVADAFNERVLKFVPPFTSGMAATGTFGNGFGEPISIEIDPLGRGIWISDLAFSALTLWNRDGTEPIKIIGKDSALDKRRWFMIPGVDWVEGIAGFGFDNDGNLLFSVTGRGHDVLRIEAPLPDKGEIPAERVKRFFYPPGGRNYWDGRDLHWAVGVAVYEDQLIVSDFARLMFWNGLDDLANGQPAAGAIGDVHYRRDHPSCCGDLKADGAGRLWTLSREGMWGYIDVYDLPLTRQSSPVHTIGTRTTHDRPVSFSVLGRSDKVQIKSRMFGLAPDAGGRFLWVSDTDNHRVLRIRDPLTNPVVDVILGQTTVEGDECNRGGESAPAADTLCFPGDLSIDRRGNLWVSDHALEVSGNFRLLMFPKILFSTDNAETIFAPDAAKIFATYGDHNSRMSVGFYVEGEMFRGGHAGPYAAATFETAFDSQNNMAAGFNMYPSGRFVALYRDPASADAGTEPVAYLNDLTSMPMAAAFDDRRQSVHRRQQSRPRPHLPQPAEQRARRRRPVPVARAFAGVCGDNRVSLPFGAVMRTAGRRIAAPRG